MQDFILEPEVIQDYIKDRRRERFESNISTIIESKVVTINKIRVLARDLGPSTTLEQILNEAQKQYRYKCPKCESTGQVEEAYYPNSRDDYPSYHMVECDICHGIGYTKKHFVPNMVQQGWKTEE